MAPQTVVLSIRYVFYYCNVCNNNDFFYWCSNTWWGLFLFENILLSLAQSENQLLLLLEISLSEAGSNLGLLTKVTKPWFFLYIYFSKTIRTKCTVSFCCWTFSNLVYLSKATQRSAIFSYIQVKTDYYFTDRLLLLLDIRLSKAGIKPGDYNSNPTV